MSDQVVIHKGVEYLVVEVPTHKSTQDALVRRANVIIDAHTTSNRANDERRMAYMMALHMALRFVGSGNVAIRLPYIPAGKAPLMITARTALKRIMPTEMVANISAVATADAMGGKTDSRITSGTAWLLMKDEVSEE